MDQYYYNPTTGLTYSSYQMLNAFGINVDTTSIENINAAGFYPVQASEPDFDTKLYDPSFVWSIVPLSPSGEGAVRVFSPTAKPLPEAKENASIELKDRAGEATKVVVTNSYLTDEVLTSVSSQVIASRPAFLQATLDEMTAISDDLGANLAAVDACTSVDEINDIVNPPTGIIFTGRGSGLGPEDLNVSYYTEFNSLSLPESDTELYVPGTSTVIAYGSGGPGKFDSLGNCFNPGDYLIQIRNSKTGFVIAEFECPLAPAGVDVAF